MKKLLNQLKKILANLLGNKNLKTDAYLYDMASKLMKDVTVIHRYENQYIVTDGDKIIFKINKNRPIDILDMQEFRKIKIELIKIGGTPQHVFYNVNKLFNSKKGHGKKISMTIHR